MKILGGTLAALAIIIITAPAVFAYQGNPDVRGPKHSPERHTAMMTVIEQGDYDAWKELMDGKGRITEVITADNFAKFVEAHELARSGDLDGAKEIREELGLRTRDGQRKGKDCGNKPSQGLNDGSGYEGGFGRMNR